jgi:hypothetical protein
MKGVKNKVDLRKDIGRTGDLRSPEIPVLPKLPGAKPVTSKAVKELLERED